MYYKNYLQEEMHVIEDMNVTSYYYYTLIIYRQFQHMA